MEAFAGPDKEPTEAEAFCAPPLPDTVKVLMNKVLDLNDAIRKSVFETLEAMTLHRKMGVPFLASYLVNIPANSLNHWRPILAQLEVLHRVILLKGIDRVHLTTANVMKLCTTAFECRSQKPREEAILVIVEVYKASGAAIREYLKDQKPALLQELRQKILKVARKDKTQRSAFQRLANIVEPLAPSSNIDGGLGDLLSSRAQTVPENILGSMAGDPGSSLGRPVCPPNGLRPVNAPLRPSTVAAEATDFSRIQRPNDDMMKVAQDKAPTMVGNKPAQKGRLIFS
eukprot:NODE_896_length_1714_cov_11.229429_g730_i0.p1 GENE.NODE_896_length_1714_cov_11.229429_g730_i0~~NODE_896_length_1714_cov_11.229429_g730_i0.p1  ORF type:complete len:285 (+),score=55.84 NODE_896_length_1714_cov_11.229429_g730_i0:722-1576(+)